MKPFHVTYSALCCIVLFLNSCNSVKRVPDNKRLLTKVEVIVDGNKDSSEEINSLLIQQPNNKLLGVPIGLSIYNLANPNPDSSFQKKYIDNPKRYNFFSKLISEKQVHRMGKSFLFSGIHSFLKKSGEAPSIIEDSKTRKSTQNLKKFYFNEGYFNAEASHEIDSSGIKKGQIKYLVDRKEQYLIDSVYTTISSPAIDSLYQITKQESLVKAKTPYKTSNLSDERNRLTSYFRNHGAYHFQQNYINYDLDTIGKLHKTDINLVISDHSFRKGDSLITEPFRIYKVSEVNIFTDNSNSRNKVKTADSITYNNYNFYSVDKFKYKPKAITDAVFISKGSTYADFRNNLTSRYLTNLKIFKYPSIQYLEDPRDSTQQSLIANIYLTPEDKYNFRAAIDVTNSNIQEFGITGNTSIDIRNIFRGAETLQLSLRGNIGSSTRMAEADDNFFNISEVGADAKINFPRIFFPLSTERIIPKRMIPSTQFGIGYSKQTNIGLDKENFTSTLVYNWNPKRLNNVRFDLMNIQYIRNIRTDRYFTVYRSSYNALNDVAEEHISTINPNYLNAQGNLIIDSGTNGFIQDALQQNSPIDLNNDEAKIVRSIEERRKRLTENNLIVASSYTFSSSTQTSNNDNDFYTVRAKVELAGNLLSAVTKLFQVPEENGRHSIFNVEFSQYAKTEIEYIKRWDFKQDNIFATRTFVGIAIPYGNSNSIPFSRSYFAGGSNDNRGWRPYSLGPGRSGSINDFNEANLKIALSAEYRFRIAGNLKGAIFADAGNIWNIFNNEELEEVKFNNLSSLKDIALGSGFGIRYDFSFFVIRFDIGFKTYDPALPMNERWFKDYNFSNSVLNIGVNYPF